jgi:hypothetical protein
MAHMNDLNGSTEAEIQRIRNAHAIFAEKKPKPKERRITFMGEYGFEVVGLIISAIGATIISALRVGTILFISEMNMTSLYAQVSEKSPFLSGVLQIAPLLIGLAGLLGFEGYIFSHGYTNGKSSGKIIISSWGLIVAFIVTTFSGLLSSMTININMTSFAKTFVEWVVMVFTGIGAPVIAYFGAVNVGVVHSKYLVAIENAKIEWRAETEKWEREAASFYTKNQEIMGSDLITHRKEETGSTRSENSQKLVQEYLEVNNISPNDVGDGPEYVTAPRTIATALQLNPSTVRSILSRLRSNKKEIKDGTLGMESQNS